jgi:hypothetical protein
MIGGPEQNGSGGKMGIEKALCMFIFYTYSKIELIIIIEFQTKLIYLSEKISNL